MPNSLTARNFDMTDEVRAYVEKKVDRLRKIFDNIQKIDVVFSSGKRNGEAELIVEATQGRMKCTAKDASTVAAFDLALDKMERQLARHKARIIGNKKHIKNAAKNARGRADAEVDESLEEAFEDSEFVEELPVVRPIRVRRMSVQEAVDAYERSTMDLLAFVEEESERVQILYCDGEGEYQIVEIVGER